MSSRLVSLARRLERANREVERATERRDEIAASLQGAVLNGTAVAAESNGKSAGRRKGLKSDILKILSGSKGVNISDIAKRTKANMSSLHGSLYLLKKTKQIIRVGPGTYKLAK